MALLHSEPGSLGLSAPSFSLKGVVGATGETRVFSLSEFSSSQSSKAYKAVLVVFMCNHCPYVLAVKDRLNALAKRFIPKGIAVVGINPNDASRYPDDSWDAMVARSKEWGFVFPYLVDETQAVAREYGAVCTPDLYLCVNESAGAAPVIRYRGRIDDSWKDPKAVTREDLALAMECVIRGEPIPTEQHSSMGCSIKWKV